MKMINEVMGWLSVSRTDRSVCATVAAVAAVAVMAGASTAWGQIYWSDSGNRDDNVLLTWTNAAYYAGATDFDIDTPEKLGSFGHMVNSGFSFSGKTVRVTQDLDMGAFMWATAGRNHFHHQTEDVLSTPASGKITYAQYAAGVRTTTQKDRYWFAGTFDGQDNTISNLRIDERDPSQMRQGFFGVLCGANASTPAVVRNTTFTIGFFAATTPMAGVVAGCSVFGRIENIHVSPGNPMLILPGHCYGYYCQDGITMTEVPGATRVGGLLGTVFATDIINCSNSADAKAASINNNLKGSIALIWGGIVNRHIGGEIRGCVNNGAFSLATASDYNVAKYGPLQPTEVTTATHLSGARLYGLGGIVGQAWNSTVADCANTGDITASTQAATCVGGIVGVNSSVASLTIENCHNTANIGMALSQYAGGVIGNAKGVSGIRVTVRNCSNNGAVSSTNGVDHIGGVAGYMEFASLLNCWNGGAVASVLSSTFLNNAGGIVGGFFTANGVVNNCVSTILPTGRLSRASAIGNAIGTAPQNASSAVINSYGFSTNSPLPVATTQSDMVKSVPATANSGGSDAIIGATVGRFGAAQTVTLATGSANSNGQLVDRLNNWVNAQSTPTDYLLWTLTPVADKPGWFGNVISSVQYPVFGLLNDTVTPYRVRVTRIEVNPVTKDVTLEWCVTNALDHVDGQWKRLQSVEIEKTEILFSDTLSDDTYPLSNWLDLRDAAYATLRTGVSDPVEPTIVDGTTHTVTITGAYINAFKGVIATKKQFDDTAAFFFIRVHGTLE